MNCRLCQPTANTATEKDGFDNGGVDETKKSNNENESGTDQYGSDQSGSYQSAADETRVQSASANEKVNATVQTASNNTPIIVLGALVGVLAVGMTVMSVLYVRNVKKHKTREIEIGSLQSMQ